MTETLSTLQFFLEVEKHLCGWVFFLPEQRFIHDPYATTFGGFSKVTNFFRAALRPPDSQVYSRTAQDPSLPPQSDEEPGFELITCVRGEKQFKANSCV